MLVARSDAQICLSRVMASVEGRHLDFETYLRRVSTMHRLTSHLYLFPDDRHVRRNRILIFSAKDAQLRRRRNRLYGVQGDANFPEIQCRMGRQITMMSMTTRFGQLLL